MDELAAVLEGIWPRLSLAIVIAVALAAAGHAVLYRRDSRSATAWVLLVLLVPFVGAVLYAGFGVNRVRRRARALGLKHTHDSDLAARWRVEPAKGGTTTSLGRLSRLLDTVSHFPILGGNRVDLLADGDETYGAMLRAIDEARRSVSFSSYIFDADRAGRRFVEALGRAAARGVAVRVLVDGIGVRYSRPWITTLLDGARVPAALFRPKRFPFALPFVNLRNHRKILVADGRIGFAGGMNVREGTLRSLSPRHAIRDVHARFEGPVVSQLQEAIADDWVFATGETLSGDAWFPDPVEAGDVVARAITSGPDEDFETIRFTLLGALSVARRRVRIVTPYFLPDASLVTALNVAAMQGVEIEIVLPERSNLPFVQWAIRATIWQVLERGCRVVLSPLPFDHSKLMVVDGEWTLVGSANWDPRSLRLNFEFDVEIHGRATAEAADRLIDERTARSRPLTLEEVDSRPIPVRLRDGVARLFSPFL